MPLRKYKPRRKTFRRYKKRVPRTIKRYIAKKLDRQIEDKYIIPSLGVPTTVNVWTYTNLITGIIQGDSGVGERVGRKIKIKSMQFYVAMTAEISSEVSTTRIVVAGYQGAPATPLSAITVAEPILKANEVPTLIRKYVDRYYHWSNTSDVANTISLVRVFKFYYRFRKPIYIQYADDNGTNPDKSLIFSILSDSANEPTYELQKVKITYEDA